MIRVRNMANETRESLTSDDVKAGAVETGLNHNIQGKLSAFYCIRQCVAVSNELIKKSRHSVGNLSSVKQVFISSALKTIPMSIRIMVFLQERLPKTGI